jgi:acetyl esterase/lipase
VPYAYLAVTVIGAVGVINAYRPLRWEALSVVTFFGGWLVGELALQNIVWQVGATVGFAVGGAFSAWPGWLGLAIALVSWCGLVGLAVSGHRAARVVADALEAGLGLSSGDKPEGPRPTWGRWWRLTRAVPLRSRDIQLIKGIDYWGDGSHLHRLDVIRPRSIDGAAPVMIYIHGGAWIFGDKREQGKPMMYELASHGWVCVTLNYRMSPRSAWPDHIVDCKRGIAWVREHIAEFGGDPSFLAVSGGSAGGHLCALAALTAGDKTWQPGFESADTSVDACLPFYGVFDFTGEASGPGGYAPALVSMLERLIIKKPISEDRELYVQASPTFRVHEGAPPFFVLHGRNDTLVPVEVARRFVAALKAVSRAPVVYAELPLAQHAFDVLASLRCQATTAGVGAFLAALRAARRRDEPSTAGER